MIHSIIFVVTFVAFESWVRRYFTKAKSFKDAQTQTEFIDLYPEFIESLSDKMSESDTLFGESSSEHSVSSAMSVVSDVDWFEILPDYITFERPDPTSNPSIFQNSCC